jgi:hypothetical protein
MQWEVLDWNTPAIDFYRAMGADFLDEWRNVRLDGEALRRLAEGTNLTERSDETPAIPPFRQKTDERMGHQNETAKPLRSAS